MKRAALIALTATLFAAAIATALVVVAGNDATPSRSTTTEVPLGAPEDSKENAAELNAAYGEAFAAACNEVFASADTLTFAEGTVTTADCLSQDDGYSGARFSDTPEQAATAGRAAGFDAPFAFSPQLCAGAQCWTRTDFK